MKYSHCTWTHKGQDYEVHYSFDDGGIVDISLYPKNDNLLSENEEDIIELVRDDMMFLEE